MAQRSSELPAAMRRKLERAAARCQRADEQQKSARANMRYELTIASQAGVPIRALADVIGLSPSATHELMTKR